MVYNRAVEEVEKILQHGKLTEEQLKELQRNFAQGVMINPPGKGGQKTKPAPILEEKQALHGAGPVQTIGAPEAAPVFKSADDTVSISDSMMTDSTPSKRRRAVDEWSIITLYNDVKHFEQQKVYRDRVADEKMRTRKELQRQIEARRAEKEASKIAERNAAQEQQVKYEQWKVDRQRQEQLRQAKILAERDKEAKELQRMQERKKAQADQDLREQQAMLDDFQRQLAEEKAQKDRQIHAKQAAYQQMLADNANVLERKRLAKEAEREENLRLFQLQIVKYSSWHYVLYLLLLLNSLFYSLSYCTEPEGFY